LRSKNRLERLEADDKLNAKMKACVDEASSLCNNFDGRLLRLHSPRNLLRDSSQ